MFFFLNERARACAYLIDDVGIKEEACCMCKLSIEEDQLHSTGGKKFLVRN
jgi:hypothetical protein